MSGIKERRDGKAKAAPASTASTSTKSTGPETSQAPTAAVSDDNVRARELAAQEQWGAGILAVMFALDEASKDDSRLPKLVHAAKLFLIAVIFIAPVLLMWQHAF